MILFLLNKELHSSKLIIQKEIIIVYHIMKLLSKQEHSKNQEFIKQIYSYLKHQTLILILIHQLNQSVQLKWSQVKSHLASHTYIFLLIILLYQDNSRKKSKLENHLFSSLTHMINMVTKLKKEDRLNYTLESQN